MFKPKDIWNYPRGIRLGIGMLLMSLLGVAFGNCAKEGGFKLASMSSSEVSRETEGGGDGYGFGGKPVGIYNRYLPEFSCGGAEREYTSISLVDGKIIYKQNDIYQCEIKSEEITYQDLAISHFQNEIFGYREGIYQVQQNTNITIPASLVEVWCHSRSLESPLELIVKFNREQAKAEARIYYQNQSNETRIISDFEVSRLAADHKIRVRSSGLELEVDRNKLSPGEFGQFEGMFQANLDEQIRSETIDCRLGGSFDPSIWPAKNFSQVEVNSLVKLSSYSKNTPHWYGFFSINSADQESQFRKEIYLFSDEQKVPEKIGFTGPELASGFKYFKFSPDGRYIYYRADAEKMKYFQLYQMDLKTKEKRLIHPAGVIAGHGPLLTYAGGFSVYSDGTLVFLNQDLNAYGALNVYTISGENPLSEPIQVPMATIAGQSLGYYYSSAHKSILFVSLGNNAGKQEYRIKSFNINSKSVTELNVISRENLNYFIFGTTFDEIINHVPYEIYLKSELSTTSDKEFYAYDLQAKKNLFYGQNLTSKYFNPIFSEVVYGLSGSEGYTRLNLSTQQKMNIPVNNSMIYSKNNQVLWWETHGVISNASFLKGQHQAHVLAPTEKIVKMLPLSEEGLSILIHNSNLGIIKVLKCPTSVSCEQVNSIPFSMIESEGFLDANLNPEEKLLALSVNMSLNEVDSVFMTYILPLDGAPAIAASGLGLGPGNKEHGNRAQLFFSYDSKVLYFVGHGWKKSVEQNQSIIYSFKTPFYLVNSTSPSP